MADQWDIVIAGGGLVGAALAVMLGQSTQTQHLRIAVVEANPLSQSVPEEGFDPRVVALTEASRAMLSAIGAWRGAVLSRACPYQTMAVRDREGTGAISFDCADVHQPNLGHIVENSVLLAELHKRIDELPSTSFVYQGLEDVCWEDEGGVRLTLADGCTLKTSLLVAADGANSRVRDRLDFKLRAWEYGHTAIVGTIHTQNAHEDTASQWFMPSGPLAFLPLRAPDGNNCFASIVWSQEHDEAQRLMALDDAAFCQELTQASEAAMGTVVSVSRRFAFPLRQRHAIDYVKGCVALVGDAAHTIHPLAGQGVNLGFGDVQVLAEEILRGLDRGLLPGDSSILQRFQRRRKPHNLGMMVAMEGFKRIFAEPQPLVRMARNAGMNHLDGLFPVKKQLIRQAMGF